jgi:site-specific DNA recombinase
VVVVYKVDRLSRSLLDFAKVMDRFNKAGVAFVSVTQNFSTADAMGRLTLNMLMSFSEFEREMIAERTRDKIAAARRKGKWTGGPVPLGYDVVDKKLVVNDLEAVVVREIFDLYEQHRSALTVARLLNEANRTTKRHRANNGNVRRAALDQGRRAPLLRNPVYAGPCPTATSSTRASTTRLIDRDRYHPSRDPRRRAPAPSSSGRNPAYLLARDPALRPLRRGDDAGVDPQEERLRLPLLPLRDERDKKGRKACPARPLPADAVEGFVVERIREATAEGALAAEVAFRAAHGSWSRRSSRPRRTG